MEEINWVMEKIGATQKAEQLRVFLDQLRKGKKEIAEGKGYDLQDVLLEADLLLMSLNPRNIRAIRVIRG